MGTGLIYAAIVGGWLAYLIPVYLRRHAQDSWEESDPRKRFSSIQIIRSGEPEHTTSDDDGAEVSTPLTRRAMLAEVRRAEFVAARRRRTVLVALMATLTLTVVLSIARVASPWLIAVPVVLLVGFFGLARYSVKTMQASLDARVLSIDRWGNDDEQTLTLTAEQVAGALDAANPGPVKQVVAGLWDPVPVTLPTYVSKPLAPRTVRTIDLSGPDITSSARASEPPTADAPVEPGREGGEDGLRRAFGA